VDIINDDMNNISIVDNDKTNIDNIDENNNFNNEINNGIHVAEFVYMMSSNVEDHNMLLQKFLPMLNSFSTLHLRLDYKLQACPLTMNQLGQIRVLKLNYDSFILTSDYIYMHMVALRKLVIEIEADAKMYMLPTTLAQVTHLHLNVMPKEPVVLKNVSDSEVVEQVSDAKNENNNNKKEIDNDDNKENDDDDDDDDDKSVDSDMLKSFYQRAYYRLKFKCDALDNLVNLRVLSINMDRDEMCVGALLKRLVARHAASLHVIRLKATRVIMEQTDGNLFTHLTCLQRIKVKTNTLCINQVEHCLTTTCNGINMPAHAELIKKLHASFGTNGNFTDIDLIQYD
jgi:hypothetical protein